MWNSGKICFSPGVPAIDGRSYEFCYFWTAGTDAVAKPNANSCSKSSENTEGSRCGISETEANDMDDGGTLNPKGNFFIFYLFSIYRAKKFQPIFAKDYDTHLTHSSREELFHLQDIQGAPLGFFIFPFKLGSCNMIMENNAHPVQNQNEKPNPTTSPKTFVGTEIFDGKAVVLL
ncbi:hypothetical protein CK203_032583 [Vitis vinifera]|uniref:Uncharacterized protein n=1 Tax=Vitis vinifera TaxID=29760 RepID=A0A438HXR6_VITVI|nr:hypothetical protein CK203_032583 [Vitis vinifera]